MSTQAPDLKADPNQVVEILLQYINLQDWAQAFHAVIPKRKYDAVGKRELRRRDRAASSKVSNPAGSDVGGDDDEDSEDDNTDPVHADPVGTDEGTNK